MAACRNLILFCCAISCLVVVRAMFDDIVNQFFGGGGGEQQQMMQRGGRGGKPQTPDASMEISIPLKELYLGSQRQISYQRNVVCDKCQGTGAKGGETKRCSKCNGQGQIVENVQVMPGFHMQQQRTCPVCGGRGVQFKHKCRHCHGEGVHRETTTLDIAIEKGMRDGQQIRFEGKSEERPGHETGALIAVIRQDPHQYFDRDGHHLRTAVDLSLKQALLGFTLNIEHLDEQLVNLNHADEITSHHQTRQYKDKGMPVHGRPTRFGDMFIEYRIQMPETVSATQRKSLMELFPDLSLRGEYNSNVA